MPKSALPALPSTLPVAHSGNVSVSKTPAEVTPRTVVEIRLPAPLPELPPDQYVIRHLDAQLSRKASANLKRLVRVLEERGVCSDRGRPIATPAQAAEWLLCQLPS